MVHLIPVLSKTPNLVKELSRLLPDCIFHEVVAPETDSHFKNAAILLCDFDKLGPHLYELPNAKWVQGTWAGTDKLKPFLKDPPSFKITRYSGPHFGRIMGEYVISNIINIERNFFLIKQNQKNCKWDNESSIGTYRTIYDLTVGIFGIGNIGSRIGQLLHFMGATVVGYGQKSRRDLCGDHTYLSDYYYGKEHLPQLLRNCHYIVNVLPQTVETTNLLDYDILENCRDKSPVYINVGRGNIITETSLIKALKNKWLGGAVLDVFNEEPLNRYSPLWKMPEVFITPHVAGLSRAKDIAEQFKKNLKFFKNNQPIPATLDLSKGY